MQRLREQLVDAGVQLLDQGGTTAVTIREVARACGVSHGTPRRHFPTLAALLASVAETCVDELDRLLSEAGTDSHALAVAYVGFAVSRPHAFDLITRHDLLEASGRNLREATVPLLTRWIDAYRSERPDKDRVDAVAAWVGVHGTATLASRRAFDVIPVETEALLARILS